MHARIVDGQPELVSPAPFTAEVSLPVMDQSGEPLVDETGEPVIWTGPVAHPASVFTAWSRAEKAAVGIYEVVTAAAPEGHRRLSYTMALVSGVVVRTPVTEIITADERRAGESCSPLQFRQALLTFDKTAEGWASGAVTLPPLVAPLQAVFASATNLGQVLDTILANPAVIGLSGKQAQGFRNALEYAQTFSRLSPHVSGIAAMFSGITPEQIDAVFAIARGIE